MEEDEEWAPVDDGQVVVVAEDTEEVELGLVLGL